MRCGMTRNPVCEAAGPLGRDGDDGHGVGVAEAVEDVHQLSIGRAGSIHDVPSGAAPSNFEMSKPTGLPSFAAR
jgi:hypothetical protein